MYIGTIIAFLDNFKSSTKYYIRNRITNYKTESIYVFWRYNHYKCCKICIDQKQYLQHERQTK